MIALLPLTFPGGDLARLARSLSDWRDAPAVALVQAEPTMPTPYSLLPYALWKPARRFEPFEAPDGVGAEALDVYLRRVSGVGCRIESGSASLWDLGWQRSTTTPDGRALPLPQGWQPAGATSVSVVKRKVTAMLPPQSAVRILDLAQCPWSRPLRAHWLLREMWTVPVSRQASEAAFLKAVAWAVGGRLRTSEAEYAIELDPVAFRERAQACVATRAPARAGNTLGLASHRVAVEAWRAIDDATLLRLFSKPNLALSRPVAKDSALARSLAGYLDEYRRWTLHPPTAMAGATTAPRGLLSRLDATRPPRIIYAQNLGASGGWPRVGGGTVIP